LDVADYLVSGTKVVLGKTFEVYKVHEILKVYLFLKMQQN